MISKGKIFLWCILFISPLVSCKKDKRPEDIVKQAATKTVLYIVRGSHIRMNYIDSNSVFQSNQVYQDVFTYQFKKGSGASIGISVFKQSQSDTIYSWSILIDGKLFANAFSEGGAYFTVPFN